MLVARHEEDGLLFAVEQVHHGIFALCKLGNWVKEDDIAKHDRSEGVLRQQITGVRRNSTALNQSEWWHSAVIKEVASTNGNEARSNPTRSIISPSPQISITKIGPGQTLSEARDSTPQTFEVENTTNLATELAHESPLKPSTPNEVYSNTIQQYLNTLYLAKTSLAYFAKGPLSRARVAFRDANNGDMQIQDLISFLRQSLLTKSMDKKYRDKLPELVRTVAMESPPGSLGNQRALKKKSKKLKPSTDGIFPDEEEYVRKWWIAADLTGTAVLSSAERDTVIKGRLAELRIRETQMQLILALEVLALEASASSAEPQNDEAGVEAQPSQVKDLQGRKKRNDRKSKDIVVFLDLLVDRLCIWQSLQQDEILDIASGDKKADHSISSQSQMVKTSNDALKAFCIEVIIPLSVVPLSDEYVFTLTDTLTATCLVSQSKPAL